MSTMMFAVQAGFAALGVLVVGVIAFAVTKYENDKDDTKVAEKKVRETVCTPTTEASHSFCANQCPLHARRVHVITR